MADQETLLERLIPGDLEHRVPAAVQKMLPGGFKNRLIQIGLGLLLAFGLKKLVERWVETREKARGLLPAAPARAAIAAPQQRISEPATRASVGAPMVSAPPSAPRYVEGVKYPLLGTPHVNLSGTVDQAMYASFREQLARAPHEGTLVVSISTLGGDPEVARLMGDDLRMLREYEDREILFLGKIAVYSAGATFMATFPVEKRFLTRGTRIMIHERILTKSINLSGPLESCVASLKAALHEIEESVRIEQEGFRDIVAGSNIAFEEVCRRAPENWYIEADEARDLGLVLDVI